MATTSSTTIAPSTVCSTAGSNDTSGTPSLQACKSSGCKVGSFVEKTKRKCSQFVSTPYIMPKPLVVNGTTAIFQMGGQMAKIGDIPGLAASTGNNGGKAIYRIKPGTHAHVINYVLVDEGSDSMEKARSGDQETMRMLLDSQRESAVTKLQKFISNHRGSTTNSSVAAPIVQAATPVPASAPAPTPAPLVTPVQNPTASVPSSTANVHVTTPQIHPDFSIASVEGSVQFASPALAAGIPAPTSTASTFNKDAERLQAEIQELRRTVARLQAETH